MTLLYITITNKKTNKKNHSFHISLCFSLLSSSSVCLSLKPKRNNEEEEEAWFQRDATVGLSPTVTRGPLLLPKTRLLPLPLSAKRFCFLFPFLRRNPISRSIRVADSLRFFFLRSTMVPPRRRNRCRRRKIPRNWARRSLPLIP